MARKDDLQKQCENLGIIPEKTRKRKNKDNGETYYESSIKDFETAVQNYYLDLYEKNGTLSPFIKNILTLDSPMLALQIKHQKPEIQEQIWQDNNNWVFQEKIDGTRCLLCYDKKYGYDFYSRNKSVTDCLPISYKTKLLIPPLTQEILDRYNINSFIIDTELVPLNKRINTMQDGTELVADTQLSLVTSILGSLDDLSHRMQETNPLKFIAFDILMLNGNWLTDLPLEKRDKSLNGMLQILKIAGLGNRIEKVQSTLSNKHQFYDGILAMGGEGVVAKDLNSKYDLLGKRAGEWVKIKRTISQSVLMEKIGDTIDAFITGFKEGNAGTSNEGLVGALEFSVYLTDENNEYIIDETTGNPIMHHIATVSGITDELRQIISNKDIYGNVVLNNAFYGRVATIDGQDISSKNMRFAHAVFKGWRPDRDAMSCKMQKSFLEMMVL